MRTPLLTLPLAGLLLAVPAATSAQTTSCAELIDGAARIATMATVGDLLAEAAHAEAMLPFARVLPHVSLSGTLIRNDREIAIELPAPLVVDSPPIFQHERTLRAALEARVALVDGAFFPLRRAVLAGARAAEHDAAAAEDSARLAAAGLCATNAELSARIDVLEARERAVAEHARSVELLLDVGLARTLDREQAALALLDVELEQLQLQAALARVGREAAGLLGREGSVAISAELPEPDLPDGTRTTVLAAQARADAAQHSVRSLKLEYLPRLVGSAQVAATDTEAIDGERLSWQLGLSLQWSIYAGQSRRAQVRAAEARVLAAEAASAEALRSEARASAEDAEQLALLEAFAALSAERAAVAERAAGLARETLAAGALAPADALDAELEANAALAAARSAEVELWLARWRAALR